MTARFTPPRRPDLVIDNNRDLTDLTPLVEEVLSGLPELDR